MKTLKKLLVLIFIGLLLTGCGAKDTGSDDKKVITVAASPVPHAEILEEAKKILAEQGYDLQITVFEDYVQPIEVVESEEIDCNYFAHTPYLDNYNETNGASQVVVAGIHYEPFGIYPGTKSSIADLEDGDAIAVPNDTTNEARALLLLAANGIIELPENAGLTITKNDIVKYNVDVDIVELEAAQVARVIPEVALVVLNGNYALEAGLSVGKDSIAFEAADSLAAETYVNVVAVKAGNENNEGVKALVEVLQSDAITNFINDTYDGAVVPFK